MSILLSEGAIHWLDQLLGAVSTWFPEHSFFHQTFNLRAILALTLVALTCGAVGSLVVGNRMAFFSDALAHCAFAGVSLGYVFFELFLVGTRPREEFWQWVTPIMVLFGIGVGAGIAYVRGQTGLASDTVIGVFFAFSLGFAALLKNIINDRSVFSLEDFLFGDPLFVSAPEIIYMAMLTVFTWGLLIFAYNRLVFSSFNSSLALSRKYPVALLYYLFVMVLALIVNLSLRYVGVLLINALLIVPAATANNVGKNLRQVFWISVLTSLLVCLGGLGASWELQMRTGIRFGVSGTIVLSSVFLFFCSMIASRFIRGQSST
ncbi:MAG: metal ABC transporter permease [Gemmataceae bacterium]|nr:metal ABC transporter permease [Gemmataceae bacterium]